MDDVLPGVLVPGLKLIFCGNAAGKVSAQRGAPFAGPGNYFWPVLNEVGLVHRSVLAYAPDHLAFVGKQAARIVLGRAVDYGRRPEPIGDVQVWVIPSTSGLARRFWSVDPWRQLVAAVG